MNRRYLYAAAALAALSLARVDAANVQALTIPMHALNGSGEEGRPRLPK